MEDDAVGIVGEAFESLLHGMLVAEVSSMDVDLVSEVANVSEFATGGCTNENVYVRAEFDETFREMRADESIGTGDENRSVSKSVNQIHNMTSVVRFMCFVIRVRETDPQSIKSIYLNLCMSPRPFLRNSPSGAFARIRRLDLWLIDHNTLYYLSILEFPALILWGNPVQRPDQRPIL